MARAIWKGAISFGLVHIPVSLISATTSQRIDFDWLDERTMDPVGYKRINKTTGKVVTKEHIVKGIEYEKGQHVVIDEDEIKAALPEATQTIDIFAFVDNGAIPGSTSTNRTFSVPAGGAKGLRPLRETLTKTGKVALAHVVIRTKQQLAAVIPTRARWWYAALAGRSPQRIHPRSQQGRHPPQAQRSGTEHGRATGGADVDRLAG